MARDSVIAHAVSDLDRSQRSLEAAAALIPGDDYVIGQLVAHAVRLGALSRADSIAADCGGTPWWCLELTGLAHHAAGRLEAAQEAFDASLRLMPQQERCLRQDVGPLLLPADEAFYRTLSCGARTVQEARFWWLTQPFYLRPLNDRRLEHRARYIGRELGQQQRLSGIPGMMHPPSWRGLLRYSWPGSWYQPQHLTVLPHEESRGALDDWPEEWWIHDWEPEKSIEDPPGYAFAPNFALASPLRDMPRSDWFMSPGRESYDPAFGPVHLLEHQLALFRRPGGTVLAAAADITPVLASADSALAGLVLMDEGGSDPVVLVEPAAGSTLRVRAPEIDGPRLISIEALAIGSPGAGRFRRVLVPPVATTNDFGLSDILLYTWTSDVQPVLDDVVGLMLGSDRLEVGHSTGIYWETYGVPPGEEIAVTVSVFSPESGGSWLRRLGHTLGVVSESPPIRFRWTTDAGDSGVTARTLELDLSRLPEGPHTITVQASVDGLGSVTTMREVETFNGGTAGAR